jgi:fructose-1,6-bisphosphatase/inositol monophosphatase family enzyme
VLDPIDGTKAFVSGAYLFGTLIALVKEGRPALGVIHQPMRRRLSGRESAPRAGSTASRCR